MLFPYVMFYFFILFETQNLFAYSWFSKFRMIWINRLHCTCITCTWIQIINNENIIFLHWIRSSKSCQIKLFILLMMLSGFSWVTWYLDSRSRSMNPWRDSRSQVWVWHFILHFPWSQSQYTHHHPSDLFLILKASQYVYRGH